MIHDISKIQCANLPSFSDIRYWNCYSQASWQRGAKPLLMTDITHILSEIEHGDPAAAERLLRLVYEELRKLAAVKLAHEKPGQTLQATSLVHEAYLKLVGAESGSAPGSVHMGNVE
jgi:hypothetical protein